MHGSPYTLLTSLPQIVGVPKHCEGFVAIWLRAGEEFTDNGFQLLFIYIESDIEARLWQASTLQCTVDSVSAKAL